MSTEHATPYPCEYLTPWFVEEFKAVLDQPFRQWLAHQDFEKAFDDILTAYDLATARARQKMRNATKDPA